jgi:type IV secretion system protein VirB5
MASVTYYINPAQVSDHAKTNPQYETINPLGVTITEFHENRVSVDPIPDGTTYPPRQNNERREWLGEGVAVLRG